MLYPGANDAFSAACYERILGDARPGDVLVCQNESSRCSELLRMAKARGMTTVFNPAPVPPEAGPVQFAAEYPTDILILNTLEARMMLRNCGPPVPDASGPEAVAASLRALFGVPMVVLTAGAAGSVCATKDVTKHCPAYRPERLVDTTGAGDTFLGFFVACLRALQRSDEAALGEALRCGNAAACVSISRAGTFRSIPTCADADALRARQGDTDRAP